MLVGCAEHAGNSKKPGCPAILQRDAHRGGLALQKLAGAPDDSRATGRRAFGIHLPEPVLGLRGKEGETKGKQPQMCQTFSAPVVGSPSSRG